MGLLVGTGHILDTLMVISPSTQVEDVSYKVTEEGEDSEEEDDPSFLPQKHRQDHLKDLSCRLLREETSPIVPGEHCSWPEHDVVGGDINRDTIIIVMVIDHDHDDSVTIVIVVIFPQDCALWGIFSARNKIFYTQ